jgi:hypothetical protein
MNLNQVANDMRAMAQQEIEELAEGKDSNQLRDYAK